MDYRFWDNDDRSAYHNIQVPTMTNFRDAGANELPQLLLNIANRIRTVDRFFLETVIDQSTEITAELLNFQAGSGIEGERGSSRHDGTSANEVTENGPMCLQSGGSGNSGPRL
ncbi:MAG: hypothetical protein MK102_01145 [Fuerstiella sp.]|nr:hypothetical protein [Fuerstiella sp.]